MHILDGEIKSYPEIAKMESYSECGFRDMFEKNFSNFYRIFRI